MTKNIETYAIFDYLYNQKAEVNEERKFFVSMGTIIASFLTFILVFFLANIINPSLNEAFNEGQFWWGMLFVMGVFASIGVSEFILHKLSKNATKVRQEAKRENIKNFQEGMLSQGYIPMWDSYDVDLWNARGMVYTSKAFGEQFKIVHTEAFRDDDGKYKARVALVPGFYA